MPGLIGISEFVDEAIDDYNSPTTSTFVSKMAQCRQTISGLEDVSTRLEMFRQTSRLLILRHFSEICQLNT